MPDKRILIIDDDEAFRMILSEALGKRGYAVDEAPNGRAAHARLAKAFPDLILLDIMMPDVDGVSLCREIRANDALKDVPILVISALGDTQTVNDAMLFGATDFVVKPVDLSQIEGKIEKALRQAEARRRARAG